MVKPPFTPVEFPTLVDRWLVVVLALSLLVSVAAVAAAAREAPRDAAIAGAVIGASILLLAVLALPTRYTVGENELEIRSGLLRQRIPLRSIRRVYATHNPLSAPAWSLDRLGVDYDRERGRSLALISPARREEFLKLIAERAGLVPDGRNLRRGP
jgi:hypothetical protein